jgi:hypothetical protein
MSTDCSFAAYCRKTTVHDCAVRILKSGEPVDIGGITIRPGDLVHANVEGIPSSCLETLPARTIQIRAFEHTAHCLLRRTDLAASEKRQRVGQLLAEYGFSG